MRVFIKAPLAHAENVDHGQQDKNRRNGDDAQRHANAVAAHALLARSKIAGVAVIAIIATAKAAAMRDFAWPSATQPGLAFDFYAIADDRHTLLRWRSRQSSWLERLASQSLSAPRKYCTRTAHDLPVAADRQILLSALE